MTVWHAAILGIVQGLSEILPVSSSAHLFILPWFFRWPYQGLTFDVALHLGTALAFGMYFFKDWLDIIGSAFTKDTKRKGDLFWYLAIGTVPAAIAGLLLEKKAETVFRSPLLIAGMLVLFALILWVADRFAKQQKDLSALNIKSALAIGLAQALAIIPGVSRSGITITAGLFAGFKRESSARISFLLSTPVICAAALLKLPKLHAADLNMAFWLGVICSGLSGYAAIAFLLNFVKKSNFNVFVAYRFILAAGIVAVYLWR